MPGSIPWSIFHPSSCRWLSAPPFNFGDAAQAEFINFCLIAMGLATLIQTTVGNRLPIIQGKAIRTESGLAASAPNDDTEPSASALGPPQGSGTWKILRVPPALPRDTHWAPSAWVSKSGAPSARS